jgi:two-component system, sensor histidine kinase and response regulator
LKVFLEDMPAQVEMLKKFLAAGDAQGVEHQAHYINGSSANIHGGLLRVVALDIEKQGRVCDLAAVRMRLPELEIRFAELKSVLEQHLQNL